MASVDVHKKLVENLFLVFQPFCDHMHDHACDYSKDLSSHDTCTPSRLHHLPTHRFAALRLRGSHVPSALFAAS